MAFSLSQWTEIASIVSAIGDVITVGRDSFEFFYNRRRLDPATSQKALLLQITYSTYTDEELESIERRIKNCRDRFISEGSGKQRAVCICSVLTDVKEGNGGNIPDEEWGNIYKQLGCEVRTQ